MFIFSYNVYIARQGNREINNKIKTQPIAIRLFVVISYDIFHVLQQNLWTSKLLPQSYLLQ